MRIGFARFTSVVTRASLDFEIVRQPKNFGRNRADTSQPCALPSRATYQLYCIVNLELENLIAHTANPV
jgi:hypothetical protein